MVWFNPGDAIIRHASALCGMEITRQVRLVLQASAARKAEPRSQNRMVGSSLSNASCLPFGLKATLLTVALYPASVANAANSSDMQSDFAAALPNGFPDDASRLAKLMKNEPRIQMAFLVLGGWDTHANQGAAQGQLGNRLAPLEKGE